MIQRTIQSDNEKEPISIPTKITVLMILVSVSELIAKTERIYYPFFTALLFFFFFKKKEVKLRSDYSFRILLFGIYSFITVIWSPAQGAINGAFVKLVVLCFLGLQLQFDYSERDYSIIKDSFLIQGIVLAIVFFIFGVKNWDGRVWIRNGSLSVDPNSISVWTIIPLCFSFEMVLKKGGTIIRKIIGVIVIAFMLFIVLQGASRAGIISLAITSILCVLCGLKDTIRKNPITAFIILLAVILAGYYILQHIPASVIKRFQYDNVNDLGGRTTKWTVLVDMLKASPINIVVGFGESSVIHYTGTVAHNMYLETLFAQGLIGLILLISFLIGVLRNAYKNNLYAVCAFIGVSIMSASLSEFTSRGVMFALFVAGMRIIKNNPQEKYFEETT